MTCENKGEETIKVMLSYDIDYNYVYRTIYYIYIIICEHICVLPKVLLKTAFAHR